MTQNVLPKDYKGPTKFSELCKWFATHVDSDTRTERMGQMFFNQFDYETTHSYYEQDDNHAFQMIHHGLVKEFGDSFYG